MILRFDRHPWGRRCYLFGRRVHHGTAGVCIASAGAIAMVRWRLAGLGAVALGITMALEDRADFPFTDGCNHPPRLRSVARGSCGSRSPAR